MVYQTLIFLVSLVVQHKEKNDEEDESDEEKVSNDARMQGHGIGDDLKIHIDVNLENSRKFELNNIGNTGIDNSSNTNVHNIGVGTSSTILVLVLAVALIIL